MPAHRIWTEAEEELIDYYLRGLPSRDGSAATQFVTLIGEMQHLSRRDQIGAFIGIYLSSAIPADVVNAAVAFTEKSIERGWRSNL